MLLDGLRYLTHYVFHLREVSVQALRRTRGLYDALADGSGRRPRSARAIDCWRRAGEGRSVSSGSLRPSWRY